MPELLEGRNAPSALLPLPSVFGAIVTVGGNEDLLFTEPPHPEEKTYYRSGANPASPVEPFSVENFVNALRVAESEGQQGQARVDTARQATEFRAPTQLAATSLAFDSFAAGDLDAIFFDARLLPPPVIHPVEPPEQEPPEEQGPPTMPEMIAEPLPTVNVSAVGSARATELPVAAREDASAAPPPAETPPPLIQPVITDPESEHNQPSPEPEFRTPPPLSQPVIMDPESEHNQELNLADAVR